MQGEAKGTAGGVHAPKLTTALLLLLLGLYVHTFFENPGSLPSFFFLSWRSR